MGSLLGETEKDVMGSAHGIPCLPIGLDAETRFEKGAQDY
jgi:hypothetical protein